MVYVWINVFYNLIFILIDKYFCICNLCEFCLVMVFLRVIKFLFDLKRCKDINLCMDISKVLIKIKI